MAVRPPRLLGTRPGRRAPGCGSQALLVLRWLRQRADLRDLTRDNAISAATAYRYLHEGLAVLADQALDLHEVTATARTDGLTHLQKERPSSEPCRTGRPGLVH